MRDLDPQLERDFFAVFETYYNLETRRNNDYTTEEYSLDRMLPLVEAADNPELGLRVIHVAGTKGKGSTAFLLEALLRSAGHRVGVFTSPHLATVRERFQVAGKLLPYERLIETGRRLEARVREAGITPSLFEVFTVLSLGLFAESDCEFAILEAGIGGTLDSTNYVRSPECCAITPISFDHMDLLGDTIEAIADQKAGIIKAGVPVVLGPQPYPEAEEVARRRAEVVGAPCIPSVDPDQLGSWNLADAPPFILENFGIALRICEVIGAVPSVRGFALPELRGRCEQIRESPLVVIDGAHNADSARRLAEALEHRYPGTRFSIVLGVVEGKDADGIFHQLLPAAAEFIFTDPESPRGSARDRLSELAEDSGVPYRVQRSIVSTNGLPADRPLLFTGSFFTALIAERLLN